MKKELTKEDIIDINDNCEYKDLYETYEGILSEPSGIPVDIKEPVIYMRWQKGYWWGNGYQDNLPGLTYESVWEDGEKPNFTIIDLILKKLEFNTVYSNYEEIKKLIHSEDEEDRDYYGNGGDYEIEYIILSEFLNFINNKNEK